MSVDGDGDHALAEAVTEDGLHVVLLVDAASGIPTTLEVYGRDGAELPRPQRLRVLPPTVGED